MTWIGNEELIAMAAFALSGGIHAKHRPSSLSRRQPFRSPALNPVQREENPSNRRRPFLGEVLEEKPTEENMRIKPPEEDEFHPATASRGRSAVKSSQ
jgi:hypothetical protein